MPYFQSGLKLAAVLALTAPAVAAAQTSAEPASRAVQFDAVVACRSVAEPAQRLACFDAAATQLAEAEKRGDIVVVSREQASAARRQAFGFSLPSLSIFDRGASPDELERLSVKARSAYQVAGGKWAVELEDGAVWQQTDNERLARNPRQGSTVEIRRAAMGGFFMNLDGQRAVRARRVK